jgi:uncharacterized lipoprotein YbaY/heat shock protein HslJ
MFHSRSLPAVFVLAAVAALFDASVARAQHRITGSATYRERIALTPDALFEVTLEDVSRADAPAEVIGRTREENPGQVPISFELRLDPGMIDPNRRYVVRASIREGGRIRFTGSHAYTPPVYGQPSRLSILMRAVASSPPEVEPSDRTEQVSTLGILPATFSGILPCADCAGIRYQINLLLDRAYMQRTTYLRDGHDASFYEIGTWSLSNDARTLTLDGGRKSVAQWEVRNGQTLRKLDTAGNPIHSDLPYELNRRPRLEPMAPRARLTGMFRYQADAARFRDCRSGLQWPVEMTGEYRTLERAYTARRPKPGAELMVSVEGRIEERPRMDDSGTEPTLVVEEFVAAMPHEKCEAYAPPASLMNLRWVPTQIAGSRVTIPEQQREPWIMLDPRSKRVSGSGGCNRVSGSFQASRDTLRFSRMTSTLMACPVLETETAFLRVLEETRRYRVLGRTLELLDGDGRLLARLEERTLR